VLGDARGLALSTVLSLAVWLVNALGMWAMFAAFSLDLPAYAAFLVLAITALALVLPSTPGYVGPFQAGTVLALGLFSVPKADALSLSIIYHAVNYVPITVVGLAYLAALNLTLGELRAAGEKS
jgi:glycosyltransferase 2 family protein